MQPFLAPSRDPIQLSVKGIVIFVITRNCVALFILCLHFATAPVLTNKQLLRDCEIYANPLIPTDYLFSEGYLEFVSSSASEVVIQKLTLLHINLIAATVLAFSEP